MDNKIPIDELDLPIDALTRTANDFTVMLLEDLLAARLFYPEFKEDTWDVNAKTALRLLGIKEPNMGLSIRTGKWLKENGFYNYRSDRKWKIGIKSSVDAKSKMRVI
ncbi:hypothetical protein [Aquabacterium sp.]|uniref:hypothetical protein n=1 Tax=Aquabacterium sp. TaxID=1872578 RepID=UPI003D6D2929